MVCHRLGTIAILTFMWGQAVADRPRAKNTTKMGTELSVGMDIKTPLMLMASVLFTLSHNVGAQSVRGAFALESENSNPQKHLANNLSSQKFSANATNHLTSQISRLLLREEDTLIMNRRTYRMEPVTQGSQQTDVAIPELPHFDEYDSLEYFYLHKNFRNHRSLKKSSTGKKSGSLTGSGTSRWSESEQQLIPYEKEKELAAERKEEHLRIQEVVLLYASDEWTRRIQNLIKLFDHLVASEAYDDSGYIDQHILALLPNIQTFQELQGRVSVSELENFAFKFFRDLLTKLDRIESDALSESAFNPEDSIDLLQEHFYQVDAYQSVAQSRIADALNPRNEPLFEKLCAAREPQFEALVTSTLESFPEDALYKLMTTQYMRDTYVYMVDSAPRNDETTNLLSGWIEGDLEPDVLASLRKEPLLQTIATAADTLKMDLSSRVGNMHDMSVTEVDVLLSDLAVGKMGQVILDGLRTLTTKFASLKKGSDAWNKILLVLEYIIEILPDNYPSWPKLQAVIIANGDGVRITAADMTILLTLLTSAALV